jgi:beta-N-acetylhexosaminidase
VSSRQPDHAITSKRHRIIRLALVAAMVGLVSCDGGGAKRAAPATTAAPARSTTTTTPPTPSSSETSTTATSQCTNAQIISAWPLERRAAQLIVIPSLNFNVTALKTTVAAGVGGILFLGNSPAPADLAGAVAQMGQSAPGGIAPMTMADEEGGGIQRMAGAVDDFPWPRQMAASMTTDQITATAVRVGRQLRQAGVDMDLAPVLDIDGGNGPNRTDADGQRSFSADPTTAAQDGVAFLNGLRQSGVIPVAKHFPGLGGTVGNTDNGAASTPPLVTLQAGALGPFRAAIAAAAPAVMVANAAVPGLTSAPASVSAAAINGLLRQELGFNRLVLTDSLSAGAIRQAGLGVPEAGVAAVTAGADMVFFGSTLTPADTLLLSPANVDATTHQVINALVTAVTTGRLPVDRLNDAVGHVLSARAINLCTS